jgi:hypothetical protein
MKKLIFITVVCAFVSAPVFADLGDVTRISLQTTTWPYYGNTGGGEFHAQVIALPIASVPSKWETFCMEEFETVGSGTNNYYGVLNTSAVLGSNTSTGSIVGGNPIFGDPLGQNNIGGVGYGDPLDPKTAYLYTKFATGTLLNYNYGGTTAERKADAAALQSAIWYIEQEFNTIAAGQATTWYNEAVGAVASGAWSGIGNVRVLNLYTGYNSLSNTVSGSAQDILVMVPVPATVLLGLLGLGLGGWKLRKSV